jgi:hypothetical protein
MTKKHMRTMTKAERFFWERGGYSYDSKKETKAQGRRSRATALADAEAWAESVGMTFTWEYDQFAESLEDMGHATERQSDGHYDGWCVPECGMGHEVLAVVAKYRDGSIAASLCGIVDPDRNYGRVIEAELASEAHAEVIASLMEAI